MKGAGDDEVLGVKGSVDGGLANFHGVADVKFGPFRDVKACGFGSSQKECLALGTDFVLADNPGGDTPGDVERTGFEPGGGHVAGRSDDHIAVGLNAGGVFVGDFVTGDIKVGGAVVTLP